MVLNGEALFRYRLCFIRYWTIIQIASELERLNVFYFELPLAIENLIIQSSRVDKTIGAHQVVPKIRCQLAGSLPHSIIYLTCCTVGWIFLVLTVYALLSTKLQKSNTISQLLILDGHCFVCERFVTTIISFMRRKNQKQSKMAKACSELLRVVVHFLHCY